MRQLGVIRDKQAFSAAEVAREEYSFCGPSPGMFLFIPCLSRMTSEISHGSLLTARFRTRLLIHQHRLGYLLLIEILGESMVAAFGAVVERDVSEVLVFQRSTPSQPVQRIHPRMEERRREAAEVTQVFHLWILQVRVRVLFFGFR